MVPATTPGTIPALPQARNLGGKVPQRFRTRFHRQVKGMRNVRNLRNLSRTSRVRNTISLPLT